MDNCKGLTEKIMQHGFMWRDSAMLSGDIEKLIREAVRPLVNAAADSHNPILRDLESTQKALREALKGWPL